MLGLEMSALWLQVDLQLDPEAESFSGSQKPSEPQSNVDQEQCVC